MGAPRVRIPSAAPAPGTPAAVALRRRPTQSRARASSEALQDAFVRVLLERGFEAMTVRELAGVAGVGIGTFYDYVGSKQALAALTIHLRVKRLGQGLLAAANTCRGRPLPELVDAVLDQQFEALRSDARAWAALFLLERQITDAEAYRKNYRRYVATWADALALAANPPPPQRLPGVARLLHVLTYGATSQALLTQGVRVDWVQLRADTGRLARVCCAEQAPDGGK